MEDTLFKELACELSALAYSEKERSLITTEENHARGEQFILHYLAFNRDGLQPIEISRLSGVTSARVASTINRLESKGLVYREKDTGKPRCVYIFITDAGRALAEEKEKEVQAYYTACLKALGEKDAKEYIRIVRKIKAVTGMIPRI